MLEYIFGPKITSKKSILVHKYNYFLEVLTGNELDLIRFKEDKRKDPEKKVITPQGPVSIDVLINSKKNEIDNARNYLRIIDKELHKL